MTEIEPDRYESFPKRLFATYLQMATSTLGLELAAFVLICATFSTFVLVPATVGLYVYQSVSGHVVSLPLQQMQGAAAGVVAGAVVFWLLVGIVLGIWRAIPTEAVDG